MEWKALYHTTLNLPISWQQIPNGPLYHAAIEHFINTWASKILGYQILKIGGLSSQIRCQLPLSHQIELYPEISELLKLLNTTASQTEESSYQSIIQADITCLPFIEKSVDACLLINTLNFVQDPHQLLREVNRVIANDGYLFVSLFNPCSKLLFTRHFIHQVINQESINQEQIHQETEYQHTEQPQASQSPINRKKNKLYFRKYLTYRVIDWLELLGFEILVQQPIALKNNTLLPLSLQQFFSPLSMIVARKRVYPFCLQAKKSQFKQKTTFNPAASFSEINKGAVLDNII